MDTFPYDSWEEASTAAQESGEGYFTWGPGGNAASVTLVVLGIILFVAALAAWVYTENKRLVEHAQKWEG
jgi:hypothetical protein